MSFWKLSFLRTSLSQIYFLSNLVASYLFEKAKAHFHPKIYHGIYRDDGLVVFKGKESVKEIKYWLDEFQQTVDKAAGNQHLQFTAEIWKPNENPTPHPITWVT